MCPVSTVMHDWSSTWDESLALNELHDSLNTIHIHSMCCTVKYRPSSTVVCVWYCTSKVAEPVLVRFPALHPPSFPSLSSPHFTKEFSSFPGQSSSSKTLLGALLDPAPGSSSTVSTLTPDRVRSHAFTKTGQHALWNIIKTVGTPGSSSF